MLFVTMEGKTGLFVTLVLCTVLPVVVPLQCYDCPSSQTMAGCRKTAYCGPEEICMLRRTIDNETKEVLYDTQCETKAECDKELERYRVILTALNGGKREMVQVIAGDMCLIQCCDDDLCNNGCVTGTQLPVSAVPLVSSTTKPPLPFDIPTTFPRTSSEPDLTTEKIILVPTKPHRTSTELTTQIVTSPTSISVASSTSTRPTSAAATIMTTSSLPSKASTSSSQTSSSIVQPTKNGVTYNYASSSVGPNTAGITTSGSTQTLSASTKLKPTLTTYEQSNTQSSTPSKPLTFSTSQSKTSLPSTNVQSQHSLTPTVLHSITTQWKPPLPTKDSHGNHNTTISITSPTKSSQSTSIISSTVPTESSTSSVAPIESTTSSTAPTVPSTSSAVFTESPTSSTAPTESTTSSSSRTESSTSSTAYTKSSTEISSTTRSRATTQLISKQDCPDDALVFGYSCYLFVNRELSFKDAKVYCAYRKTHLVHVDSMKENEFVKNTLKNLQRGPTQFWIGITDDETETKWKFVDNGKTATFFDWYPSEPDGTQAFDGNVDADCAVFDPFLDYQWRDEDCSPYHYSQPVCEIEFRM